MKTGRNPIEGTSYPIGFVGNRIYKEDIEDINIKNVTSVVKIISNSLEEVFLTNSEINVLKIYVSQVDDYKNGIQKTGNLFGVNITT